MGFDDNTMNNWSFYVWQSNIDIVNREQEARQASLDNL
jgi:hypothetical protein